MDRMLEAVATGFQAVRLVCNALGARRVRASDDGSDAGELEWLYRSEAFAEDLL